jgi:hypothetical protein
MATNRVPCVSLPHLGLPKVVCNELNTIARHRSTLMRMQYLLAIGVFALLLGMVVWIALEYVPR